uniref:Uncharacterized protein n=1 Tax=Glossina austeni TaxID=7395 RepID=A0A1A9V540_GLOAU
MCHSLPECGKSLEKECHDPRTAFYYCDLSITIPCGDNYKRDYNYDRIPCAVRIFNVLARLARTSTVVPRHYGFYRRPTTEDFIKDFSCIVRKGPQGHHVQSSIPKYNGKTYYLIT